MRARVGLSHDQDPRQDPSLAFFSHTDLSRNSSDVEEEWKPPTYDWQLHPSIHSFGVAAVGEIQLGTQSSTCLCLYLTIENPQRRTPRHAPIDCLILYII